MNISSRVVSALTLLFCSVAFAQQQQPDEPQPADPPKKEIKAVRIGPDFGATKSTAGADEPQPEAAAVKVPEKKPAVVSLINANTIVGDIRQSDSPDVIRWQGSEFLEPFVILTDAIKSIKFPAAAERLNQTGEFAFELASGDLLSGKLAGWDDEKISIESELFGSVHVKTSSMRRMYRIEENPTLVFSSLAGLQDWTSTNWKPDGWNEDGAQLWTEKDDAALNGNLDVPDRAMIEFEISWKDAPNFVFAIAVDHNKERDQRMDGWRFETFGNTLAVMREYPTVADVAKVDSLQNKKSVRLLAYLDQIERTLVVYRPDGTKVAELGVEQRQQNQEAREAKSHRGIRLVNRHGHVRLERLRVSRWSGKIPKSSSGGDINVSLADGGMTSGDSIRFDAEQNAMVITDRQDESWSVPVGDIVGVKMTGDPVDLSELKSSMFLHDGTRISGVVDSITADHWVMKSDEFTELVKIPRDMARTFIVMQRDPIPAQPNKKGRSGRLELGKHKLTGRLVPAIEQEAADVSCLRWHPFGCLNSSPLKLDAAGRIVYREPPPTLDPATRRTAERALQMQRLRLQQQKRGLNFGQLFLEKADRRPTAKRIGPDAHKLHIRSGDVIPCLVEAIDEQGVHISTAVADGTFVPHEKVKAVELVANVSPPDLKEIKRLRLLTLPRLQKNSPPTHLLCSRNGDFLRCRLIEFRDDVVRIELHLEEMDIPRDRIAQIIWFHPQELLAKEKAAKDKESVEIESPFEHMAQVLKRDGKRVTFNPTQVDDEQISGISDVLGECHFKISDIDQLLFGEGIRDAVSVLPYNQWALNPAVEPLMAQDLPEGGAPVGSESALIGKEAPEINLDMLNGERFVLSQCRDQIVVLDFWATWCAPCMQTMPLVEEAMADFDPERVRLVSVNLEEPADHVRSVLERHKLNVPVALDIDGVAAHRYEARAIPQMVIVDQEGKIARLYVGGGPKIVEQMKAAISDLLDPGAE